MSKEKFENAQDFVDALRADDYFGALKFVDFVAEKHAIGSGDFETLFPLLITELMQTDVSENDIPQMRFISNYFKHYEYTAVVDLQLSNMQMAMANCLVLKKHGYTQATKEDLENDASEVSQTLVSNGEENFAYQTSMIQKLNTAEISRKVQSMSQKAFEKFSEGFQMMKASQQLPEQCDFIAARLRLDATTRLSFKKHIADYQTYLENELMKEGIMIECPGGEQPGRFKIQDENLTSMSDSDEYSPRQSKLITRLMAINEINMQIYNKEQFDAEDARVIGHNLAICKRNEPSWFERRLLDKLTDIFTFGIKPLVRAIMNQEGKINKEIDQNAANLGVAQFSEEETSEKTDTTPPIYTGL